MVSFLLLWDLCICKEFIEGASFLYALSTCPPLLRRGGGLGGGGVCGGDGDRGREKGRERGGGGSGLLTKRASLSPYVSVLCNRVLCQAAGIVQDHPLSVLYKFLT